MGRENSHQKSVHGNKFHRISNSVLSSQRISKMFGMFFFQSSQKNSRSKHKIYSMLNQLILFREIEIHSTAADFICMQMIIVRCIIIIPHMCLLQCLSISAARCWYFNIIIDTNCVQCNFNLRILCSFSIFEPTILKSVVRI